MLNVYFADSFYVVINCYGEILDCIINIPIYYMYTYEMCRQFMVKHMFYFYYSNLSLQLGGYINCYIAGVDVKWLQLQRKFELVY